MAKKLMIYRFETRIQPQAFNSIVVYRAYGHKFFLGGELYNVAYGECII